MKIKIVTLAVLLTSLIACKDDATSKIDNSISDDQLGNTAVQVDELTNTMSITTEAEMPADGKYPTITFSKKEHDFGTINEGDKVETTINFTNDGEADLIIASANASCGCTVPEFTKEPIKPGASGSLKISFDSTGKPGNQQKTVTVTSNTANKTDMLTIRANVTPKQK